MLNKHENPSDTSKSKRQKQKQNECMTNILNTDANANVGRVRYVGDFFIGVYVSIRYFHNVFHSV
jgi:hypothetical protein